MSMNIFICAQRKIRFTRKDDSEGTDTQTLKFDAWQTPTSKTYEIVQSEDPKKAYIDWVISISVSSIEPIYAQDDIFQEREPIGHEEVNPGIDHIKELEDWAKRVQAEGYTVNFEVI